MPFIRQTRDKRGFEHTYVMHQYHQGGQRPRVLYVFRSPASLKVGRTALDAEVMEALEHTHPDLSFDWAALTRDPGASRVDLPSDRPPRRPQGRPPDRQPPPEPEPVAVVPPDESLLGRTLGAAEAARLRRRYNELAQRIARRARTPEERDRLAERAARLNPDEWADQPAIRANAPGADAELDAISRELPSRRRGRRGGRRRPDEARPASGIMAGETPATDEAVNESAEDADSDGAGDPGSDRSAVGPDAPAGANAETDADPDAEASDAGPDVPVGD